MTSQIDLIQPTIDLMLVNSKQQENMLIIKQLLFYIKDSILLVNQILSISSQLNLQLQFIIYILSSMQRNVPKQTSFIDISVIQSNQNQLFQFTDQSILKNQPPLSQILKKYITTSSGTNTTRLTKGQQQNKMWFLDELKRFEKNLSFESKQFNIYQPDISTSNIIQEQISRIAQKQLLCNNQECIQKQYILDFGQVIHIKKKLGSKNINWKVEIPRQYIPEVFNRKNNKNLNQHRIFQNNDLNYMSRKSFQKGNSPIKIKIENQKIKNPIKKDAKPKKSNKKF